MKKAYIKSPLNYTGGKSKLLPQIVPLFPTDIDTFVDLFTGGGNICANVKANRIIANDYDNHIINIFKELQKRDIDDVINEIETIIDKFSLTIEDDIAYRKFRTYYNNSVRINDESKFSIPIMLFVLICFSFNHQLRFNSNDEFNMPFGKNRSKWNDSIKKNLIEFSKSINENKIIFTNYDFKELKTDKLSGYDFVYCDPPYLITCATYNEKNGWNEQFEKDLLQILDNLNDRNIKFALSNALFSKGKTNDILIEWAENKYNIHHLDYTYQNCNYHTKDKTSKPDEVLITNY